MTTVKDIFDRIDNATAALDGLPSTDAVKAERDKYRAALMTVKLELAALTPDPRNGDTLAAWESLCPKNAADRACLRDAWIAIQDVL